MDELTTGMRLAARYEVLGRLGQGGMGAVYRVHDLASAGEELALKVIRVPGGITPELRLRFKQEFLAMTKLRHPNTIAVHDYGQLDGETQYLTMSLVPGDELADLVAAGPLAIDRALALLTQLLQALGFIHSRLYVHRDIKAQNVRVAPDGALTLMDFGLMSQLGLPIQAGRLSGSPGYLPPETVRGGVADASTDLYAVGCLAYELLTGRLPFVGTLMEVVRAHASQAPERPSRLRADLPDRLEAIVLRLLAKDQRVRYQSAAEVLDDLAVLTGTRLAGASPEQQRSYLKSSVLVGRDAEMAVLEADFARARTGEGGAVLVAAPAGVGKSRLVEEFLLHAKLEDAVVLAGRCPESGLAPYEPATQALRPLLGRLDEARRAALAPLFPEVGAGPGPSLADEEARLALHEAVAGALDALGEPVVFALEDLHWADAQTVALFNHLARGGAGRRRLCLASLRGDEVPPGHPAWASSDEGAARLLALAPLAADQTDEFLRSLLGAIAITPEVSRMLCDAAGGNPFFLTELLRWLLEQGALRHADGAWRFPEYTVALQLPASVEATVLRRLAGLGPEAAALARVAAVAGREPSLGMLLAASDLAEDDLFARLGELVERQFLVRTEAGCAFPHDKVREALCGHLDADERATIHQRCADWLEARMAEGGDDDVLFDLAHHAAHGRDRAQAHRHLAAAGDRAYARGADVGAVGLWTQAAAALEALGEPPTSVRLRGLWRAIGEACFALSPGVAIPALEKLTAAEAAEPARPDDHAGRLRQFLPLRLLTIAYGLSGQPRLSLATAEHAGRVMPPDETGALAIVHQTIVYAALFNAGRFDELQATATRVDAAFERIGPANLPAGLQATRLSTALQLVSGAFQGVRPPDEAIARAFQLGAELGDPEPILLLYLSALWPAVTGRQEEAEPALDRLQQTCRRLNMPPHPWLLYIRPFLLWQRGEFESARAMLAQGLAYPHLAAMDLPRQLMILLDGQVQLDLGDVAGAHGAFAAALARARERGMGYVELKALAGLGRVALAQGDLAGARQVLEEARAAAAEGPLRNPLEEASACRLLGDVALAGGDRVVAKALLGRALAIVSAPEQDNLLHQGLTHRSLGALHQAAGDRPAAAAAYREAGERFHRLRNRHLLHGLNQRLDALLTGPAAAPAPVEVAPEDRWMALRALQML